MLGRNFEDVPSVGVGSMYDLLRTLRKAGLDGDNPTVSDVLGREADFPDVSDETEEDETDDDDDDDDEWNEQDEMDLAMLDELSDEEWLVNL